MFRTRAATLVNGANRARDDEDQPVEAPDATQEWSLASDLGRRYARVSGDINPIHLHALSARAFGFRRAIAHGMERGPRLGDASPQ